MGQPGTDITRALDHVEHAGRYAGFDKDLRQLEGAHWRFLRGLEDHAVAGSQGRGGLPAGNLQRVVPRTDTSAHAQRLTTGVIEIPAKVLLVALYRGRQPRKILQGVCTGYHVYDLGFLPGFAGVLNFQGSQFVITLPQQRHGTLENTATLGTGHRRPDLEAVLGAVYRGLLDSFIGDFHFIDHFARGRIHNREGFTGGIGHGLAVDKVLITGQFSHGIQT